MAITNVPPVSWNPAIGFVAPSEAEILAGRQADIDAAFGGGVNPALETPQGQIASSDSAIIGNVNDTFVFYTQQVDPAYAEGRMQDAIARIYFLERNPAEPTVVQCLCTGLDGVTIPVGALAVAQDGNIYTSTQQGTISGGTVTLSFSCNAVGPIQCPANTLNAIYQAIPGWDTINNPSDGVVGANVETRQAFEIRRAASVALNSIGSLPSVRGAVLNVSGVLDAYVTENVLNTANAVGGVTLAPHSIYVAAVGGTAAAVAEAIWSKKAPGCGYNGNTTVVVQDTGYNPPYPSYNVTFEIPTPLSALFAVSIANNPQVPSNASTLIQNAIINEFNGGNTNPRQSIGDTIYASRYYAAVAALGSWVQLISIFVSSINTAVATFSGSISGTTLTITGVISGGPIAIGQVLTDSSGNILPGTTITAGSGMSWTVSNSQTVASEAMGTAKPTLVSTYTNINQVPTINANNIAVTLV